jgi:tetratricopeptide (TPR) repeat protein
MSADDRQTPPPPPISGRTDDQLATEAVQILSVEAEEIHDMDLILPLGDLDVSPELGPASAEDDGLTLLAEAAEDLDILEDGVIVDASGLSEGAQPLSQTTNDEIAILRREAEALRERQPERAALMLIEAATAAQRGDQELAAVTDELEEGLELEPNVPWLVSRARRMFMLARDHQRTPRLGLHEVQLGGNNSNRAAVLVETSSLVRFGAQKPEVALKLLEQALQLQEHNIPALYGSAALHTELGNHPEAADLAMRLGDSLTDPQQRSSCYFAAGTICEMHLGQLGAAQRAYSRAVKADPNNAPALLSLCQVYRETSQWPELCHALEHLADLVEDPSLQAELLLEAGAVHLDLTRDLAAAARVLGRAARATPEDTLVLERLAHAYRLEGRVRQTVDTLRQLYKLTLDKQGRAVLLTDIGRLHAALHETDQAIVAYREAVEQVPGYIPALQELGALYRSRGDNDGLVSIAHTVNEGLLPVGARAIRYVEVADLLDHQLNRVEDAVAAYQRAIELVPDMHLAYWRLTALLRRIGWHDQLAETLGNHAAICVDAATRNHLLVEQAAIQRATLGAPDAAIETLRGASAEALPNSVTLQLIDLYESQARHADLVDLLLVQAEFTTDKREAEQRRTWAALVLEHELNEYDRAKSILSGVLEDDPSDYAVIHALGRIIHRQGAWDELVKLYHHELTVFPERSDAAMLLFRMGHVIDQRLGNTAVAISAYGKALDADPSHRASLVSIERLVRAEGHWAQLLVVLRRFAATCEDKQTASAAYCRAAEVACWQLGQADQAVELYGKALEIDPELPMALYGLVEANERQQKWREVAAALERLIDVVGDERRHQLELRLARLEEFRLKQPAKLEFYERAASGPHGDHLREEIARVWRTKNVDSLSERLAELGRKTLDDALAAAQLLEAFYRGEFHAGTESAGNENRLDVITEAYRRKPSELAVVWALERALVRGDRWTEYATLTERQAQLELDRAVRVQQLASAADAHWRAGAVEDAERVARECINFDAHCIPALLIWVRSSMIGVGDRLTGKGALDARGGGRAGTPMVHRQGGSGTEGSGYGCIGPRDDGV